MNPAQLRQMVADFNSAIEAAHPTHEAEVKLDLLAGRIRDAAASIADQLNEEILLAAHLLQSQWQRRYELYAQLSVLVLMTQEPAVATPAKPPSQHEQQTYQAYSAAEHYFHLNGNPNPTQKRIYEFLESGTEASRKAMPEGYKLPPSFDAFKKARRRAAKSLE